MVTASAATRVIKVFIVTSSFAPRGARASSGNAAVVTTAQSRRLAGMVASVLGRDRVLPRILAYRKLADRILADRGLPPRGGGCLRGKSAADATLSMAKDRCRGEHDDLQS